MNMKDEDFVGMVVKTVTRNVMGDIMATFVVIQNVN
jgi:hypothetical protein